MCEGQLGSVEKLKFDGMSRPTVRDMEQLGRCLSLCRRLGSCSLMDVGLTDEAGAALFSTLAIDAHIQTLNLSSNQLGLTAAKAIAAYLLREIRLKELVLLDNDLGDEGKVAIKEASWHLPSGSKTSRHHPSSSKEGNSSSTSEQRSGRPPPPAHAPDPQSVYDSTRHLCGSSASV